MSTNHFHHYSPRHKLFRPSCDFLPGSNCWTLCTVRRGSTSFLPSFLPHFHSSFASNTFLLQTRPKHSASTSIDCIYWGWSRNVCFHPFTVDATSQSCQIGPGGCLRPTYLDYTKQVVRCRTIQWPRYSKIPKCRAGRQILKKSHIVPLF